MKQDSDDSAIITFETREERSPSPTKAGSKSRDEGETGEAAQKCETPAISPTAGSLSARVYDRLTYWPISGATVTIKHGPSVKTDERGRFLITGIEPGKWKVSVHREGYLSQSRKGTVTTGATTDLEAFHLIPACLANDYSEVEAEEEEPDEILPVSFPSCQQPDAPASSEEQATGATTSPPKTDRLPGEKAATDTAISGEEITQTGAEPSEATFPGMSPSDPAVESFHRPIKRSTGAIPAILEDIENEPPVISLIAEQISPQHPQLAEITNAAINITAIEPLDEEVAWKYREDMTAGKEENALPDSLVPHEIIVEETATTITEGDEPHPEEAPIDASCTKESPVEEPPVEKIMIAGIFCSEAKEVQEEGAFRQAAPQKELPEELPLYKELLPETATDELEEEMPIGGQPDKKAAAELPAMPVIDEEILVESPVPLAVVPEQTIPEAESIRTMSEAHEGLADEPAPESAESGQTAVKDMVIENPIQIELSSDNETIPVPALSVEAAEEWIINEEMTVAKETSAELPDEPREISTILMTAEDTGEIMGGPAIAEQISDEVPEEKTEVTEETLSVEEGEETEETAADQSGLMDEEGIQNESPQETVEDRATEEPVESAGEVPGDVPDENLSTQTGSIPTDETEGEEVEAPASNQELEVSELPGAATETGGFTGFVTVQPNPAFQGLPATILYNFTNTGCDDPADLFVQIVIIKPDTGRIMETLDIAAECAKGTSSVGGFVVSTVSYDKSVYRVNMQLLSNTLKTCRLMASLDFQIKTFY